jgi:hypothetical protein
VVFSLSVKACFLHTFCAAIAFFALVHFALVGCYAGDEAGCTQKLLKLKVP